MTAVSTLMLTAAPALGHYVSQVSYGDWLREQLRVPADEALELSLTDAEAQRHDHIQKFLVAVIDHLEASGIDAGRFFGVDDLSGGHLVTYLESRFSHLTADALPARVLLTIAPTTTLSSERSAAFAVPATAFHHFAPRAALATFFRSNSTYAATGGFSSISPRAP